MEFVPLGKENVEESDLLDMFADYAVQNGGQIACKFLSQLLVSTLNCAEQVEKYEIEFPKGRVLVTLS